MDSVTTSQLQVSGLVQHSDYCTILHVLRTLVWVYFLILWFLPLSEKNAGWWIIYAKLVVNGVWMCMCVVPWHGLVSCSEWIPTPILLLSGSWDRLWNHHDPNQNKAGRVTSLQFQGSQFYHEIGLLSVWVYTGFFPPHQNMHEDKLDYNEM